MGPTCVLLAPRWAPCWPHEPCYQGLYISSMYCCLAICWLCTGRHMVIRAVYLVWDWDQLARTVTSPVIPSESLSTMNHAAYHNSDPVVKELYKYVIQLVTSLITRFMVPTWGPSGADRTQVCPMLVPWTLLSGMVSVVGNISEKKH